MTDISVITTCHDVGRLMHATIKSIRLAIAEAIEVGLTVEWIFLLDRANQASKDYVQRHLSKDVQSVEVDFGDLGRTRNHGTQIATGEFISHVDSDDLWCPNWLTAAYAFARSLPNDRAILHAAVGIFFEGKQHLWTMVDSESFEFCPSALFSNNCFAVSSFGPREIYLKYPYPATDLQGGFGFEDWHFNCETLGNGVPHKLVPNTFQCYRVKSWKQSLETTSFKSSCIIKPTKLFALAYQNNLANDKDTSVPEKSNLQLQKSI